MTDHDRLIAALQELARQHGWTMLEHSEVCQMLKQRAVFFGCTFVKPDPAAHPGVGGPQ